MQQPKLNQKNTKWVEYLQNFTFVLKHISGQSNKVADALRGRTLVIQEIQIQVTGFDFMKELYAEDADFKEDFEACKNLVVKDRSPWLEYMLQDGFLFKNNQLCIPKCSMREDLVQRKA
jgi:hypothetical protein